MMRFVDLNAARTHKKDLIPPQVHDFLWIPFYNKGTSSHNAYPSMKILWSWLNEHLSLTESIDSVLYTLTHSGTEAEKTEAYAWTSGFQVAQVVSTAAHPNAENLKICDVRLGSGENISIVCGAKNVRPALKTIVALPGCVLPGSKVPLAACVLRGIASHGMLCSAQELAMEDIWGSEDGLVELAENSVIGTPLRHFLPMDDALLDLNITPNRGDLFSHRGVARELVALGMGTAKPRASGENKLCTAGISRIFGDIPPAKTVLLEAKECAFFQLCRMDNVDQKTTPSWMRRRLQEASIQGHGPCVDFTNYAAEDNGQPLHVFDADAVDGTVRIRTSTAGESFQALDGETYTLPEGCLVICDDTGILSLAGIMGGMRGRCQLDTRTVFLESASFDPVSIARAGRLTRLHSASRSRFERGVDPGACLSALENAALWMTHNTNGVMTGYSCIGALPTRQSILFDPDTLATRCGARLSMNTIVQRLENWGAVVTPALLSEIPRSHGAGSGDTPMAGSRAGAENGTVDSGAGSADTPMLTVIPPSWRWDWQDSWDCATEIVRTNGYTDIPTTLLPAVPLRVSAHKHTGDALPALDYSLMWALRDFWISAGLYEVVTWSFLSANHAQPFFDGTEESWNALHLINPMSKDLAVLRPSILPSLVNIAGYHQKYGLSFQPIFEIGPRFSGLLPANQQESLTALWPLKKHDSWSPEYNGASKEWSFYDVKALMDRCVRALNLPNTMWVTDTPSWYHPGQSACLIQNIGGQEIHLATIGKLHPRLNIEAFGAELHLNAWTRPTRIAQYIMPSLQPVGKDLSFYIPTECLVGTVLDHIQNLPLAELERIVITDIFQDTSVSNAVLAANKGAEQGADGTGNGEHDQRGHGQGGADTEKAEHSNAHTSDLSEKTPSPHRSITIRCIFQPLQGAFSSEDFHHLMLTVAECAHTHGWVLRGSLEDIKK